MGFLFSPQEVQPADRHLPAAGEAGAGDHRPEQLGVAVDVRVEVQAGLGGDVRPELAGAVLQAGAKDSNGRFELVGRVC